MQAVHRGLQLLLAIPAFAGTYSCSIAWRQFVSFYPSIQNAMEKVSAHDSLIVKYSKFLVEWPTTT